MAIRTAADVGFLRVNGANIVSDLTSVNDMFDRRLIDSTGLGMSAQRFEDLGFTEYTLDYEGFHSDELIQIIRKLKETESHWVAYAIEGDNTGQPAIISKMFWENRARSPGQHELTRVSAALKSDQYKGEFTIVAKGKASQPSLPAQVYSYSKVPDTGGFIFAVAFFNISLDDPSTRPRVRMYQRSSGAFTTNTVPSSNHVAQVLMPRAHPDAYYMDLDEESTDLLRYLGFRPDFAGTPDSSDSFEYVVMVKNQGD